MSLNFEIYKIYLLFIIKHKGIFKICVKRVIGTRHRRAHIFYIYLHIKNLSTYIEKYTHTYIHLRIHILKKNLCNTSLINTFRIKFFIKFRINKNF